LPWPGRQDCITIRKGPYEPDEARIIRADVEAGRESVHDALKRFIHKGQIVRVEGIEGPVSYRNGRVGLIVHTQQDEEGRFCVELNDFDGDCKGDLEQTWLRLPPTNLRLQVGMVQGLFFDFQFEKAAIKAGKMRVPSKKERELRTRNALAARPQPADDDEQESAPTPRDPRYFD